MMANLSWAKLPLAAPGVLALLIMPLLMLTFVIVVFNWFEIACAAKVATGKTTQSSRPHCDKSFERLLQTSSSRRGEIRISETAFLRRSTKLVPVQIPVPVLEQTGMEALRSKSELLCDASIMSSKRFAEKERRTVTALTKGAGKADSVERAVPPVSWFVWGA